MDAFREQIRKSIRDEALQAALDANAERRTLGRISAFASLPDYEERRQRAHQVRREVIDHLDSYLARFTARVESNGIQVHRAWDDQEAIRIFLQIASEKQARLVAKSKSMVSEEINFNHALESAGLQPVETDLGEYIVQLRGERPSHIITPAVHLRRHEVGALFHDKLGIPYTEDIPTLTDTARQVLRQVFLTADIGLSGVNFGIAETGTLCLVTNEGNGRMVTSLPRTHVALMGMERLLPRLDDLSLFLSLLPRSATAQKLSVYTSLIHSPRRDGEVEGPLERHLILVDNGRSRLLRSELKEALFCIRCGACLNACPVFREISGHGYVSRDGRPAPYPGPIGSVISPGLCNGEGFSHLAQASSLCGACREACPVDIDLPALLLRVRAGKAPADDHASSNKAAGLPALLVPFLKAFRITAFNHRRFSLVQKSVALAARLVSPRSAWMRLPAFTGWGYSKDLPRPALKPFRQRWSTLTHAASGKTQQMKMVPPSSQPAHQKTPDLADQFCQELATLGGRCIACDPECLKDQVISILKEKGITRLMADGYGEILLSESGFTLVGEPDADCRVGLTRALAGLADTGSLLVTSGQGQLLSATLLPDTHIAILSRQDLHASLADVLSDPRLPTASSAAVITGPSRTADIEMTLTIGVHGPGELIVLLVG